MRRPFSLRLRNCPVLPAGRVLTAAAGLAFVVALAITLTLALPHSDASAGNTPTPDHHTAAPQQSGDNNGNDGGNGDPGEDGADDGGVAGDGGAFAASGGAVAAAGASTPLEDWSPASASEPYDLAVTIGYTSGSNWEFLVWAENRGSRDVHGVEVLLDRVNPLTGKVYYKFEAATTTLPDGAVDFGDIDYVKRDSGSGVWRIGTLPAGSRTGAQLRPVYDMDRQRQC